MRLFLYTKNFTTVDLTACSTTEQMNASIAAAINALNIGECTKATDLNNAFNHIKALEDVYAAKVEKSETNGNIMNISTKDHFVDVFRQNIIVQI